MADSLPSLSISDVTVTEGQTASFTVTLSQASSQIVTTGYTFIDWTATSNTFRRDFSTPFGSLTFNPGETQKTISVLTSDDITDEDTEAFLVKLTNPLGATLADGIGQGTILDNDTSSSTLTISSLSPANAAPGSSTIVGALRTFIDINFAYQNNTANPVFIFAGSAGGELSLGSTTYATGSGTATQGVSRQSPGEIRAIHLFMQESLPGGGFGNVIKEISLPTSYLFTGQTDLAVSKPVSADLVQLDQEFTYTVNLSSLGPYAAEDVELTEILPKGLTYVRSFPPAEVTQVGETTQLKLLVDSVSTFFDRSVSITVRATAEGRPINNPQEWNLTTSSSVTSRSPAITGDPGVANNAITQTITVIDPPTLSIGNTSVGEGDSGTTNMAFTVSLSAASSRIVTVGYETFGLSANAGSDFTAVSGTLTFAAGETSKTITVPVLGDTIDEFNELFSVQLRNPTNAKLPIAGVFGSGTIIDDDGTPVQRFLSLSGGSIQEGNNGTQNLNFAVTLSEASSSTVTVDYQTFNDTATAGSDYTATSATLTFAPGETSKTIAVAITGDALVEPNERFLLELSNPVGASLNFPDEAFGTILNDDQNTPLPIPPSLTIADSSIEEGDSGTKNLTFSVSLSAASSQSVTVNYATVNDTATAGSDYTATSGTLTFAPGEISKAIAVAIIGDTQVEPDETLRVNLSNPTNATLADSQAQGTIQNRDVAPFPPVIQFSSPATQVSEAGQSINFTLSRSGEFLGNASSVQITVTGGTATAGLDYSSQFPLTVNFASGEQTQVVSIPILQDNLVEGSETLTLALGNANDALLGSTNTVTLEILDDDVPVIPDNNPFTGGSGNDTLTGNTGSNVIAGGAGDDIVNGSLGTDTLTGGTGRDRFVFDINRKFRPTAMGVDRIVDFKPKEDKLVLDRDTFTKLKRLSFATVKNVAEAKKTDALITYIRKTGALFYNENGAKSGFGQGGQFADLQNGLALGKAAFSIVN